MADTLTPNILLTNQEAGGNNNTWGDIADNNFELIDDKFGDTTSITTTGGTTVLTNSQEIAAHISVSGSQVSNATIQFSGRGGLWLVSNLTTGGAFTLTCKLASSTGVTIGRGDRALIVCNSTASEIFKQGEALSQTFNNIQVTGGSITGITDLAVADGGTGASNATNARSNLGLGTLATQNANNVAITGGTMSNVAVSGGSVNSDVTSSNATITGGAISGASISGIPNLAVADGGTGASTAADARTNLGLGTMATQNANGVSITGGSITGITDLAVADGGTGASNAANARSNLGLVIGTNVQAFHANLSAVSALSGDGHIVKTGAGTVAARTIVASGNGLQVTNGDGVSGNPTLAPAHDLAALEALGSTGIAARTGTNTWAQRTITAGNGITVANGNGVSGNPTVSGDFTTSSDDGLTDYPIGTTLLVNPGETTPARNSSTAVYISSSNSYGFSTVSGTQLAGTWRARGIVLGSLGHIALYQRVA